jgi:hypothetical protein
LSWTGLGLVPALVGWSRTGTQQSARQRDAGRPPYAVPSPISQTLRVRLLGQLRQRYRLGFPLLATGSIWKLSTTADWARQLGRWCRLGASCSPEGRSTRSCPYLGMPLLARGFWRLGAPRSPEGMSTRHSPYLGMSPLAHAVCAVLPLWLLLRPEKILQAHR